MSNTFFHRLEKYVMKYSDTDVDKMPHFKYGEATYIDPQTAMDIYSIYKHRNTLQELWEKECDYNRLLRIENSSLANELDAIYDECDCNDNGDEFIIKLEDKEYVS